MTTLDRLRILIALAVLRNTPVDQTHSSYILSLQESFPSSESPFDFWKGHARRLEKECIELRAALGGLQIRSFIDIHASSTQSAEFSESAVPSSNNLSAMKTKSNKKTDSTAEMEVVNLTDILKSGRIGIRLGRPLEAMDAFLQLWSLSDRPGFPREVFLTATRDVCKAVSSAFHGATKERTNLKALQVVQASICALVDKAVPLVLSWITEHDEALSLLFDHLLELFLNPVVHAFLIVSERNLSYMRNADCGDSPAKSGQSPTDYVDGRVSILALLQITFSHIQSALSISATYCGGESHSPGTLSLARIEFAVMIHSFILAIVRHIRDILQEGDTTNMQKPTRRRRIKRLAVKDTFWYLCSAVHFLLDLQDRPFGLITSDKTRDLSRQQHRLELLRQTTLDVIVDLVLYQDRKRAERHNNPSLQGCVEPQELSLASTLDSETDVEAINYLVLDDMGYRMFLGLLERFLSRD